MKKKILKMVLLIALSGNFLLLSAQSTCILLNNGTQECHQLNSISSIKVLNGTLIVNLSQQTISSYPIQEIRKILFTSSTGSQINQTQRSSMRVYPNPVGDILTIEVSEQLRGNSSIDIYSMDGRLIQALRSSVVNGTTQINVSSLSQGVYICRIRNGNQTSSIQFVKQ